ncbi:COBRA-like protein 1 [Capsicum baccatum]|uniref:COBRA-like protein 1 n=1 Tax=Capsicum baccatum TaxID=33114 RepID=A0A2G2WHB3_CAPBA|nr:COBRA-like protein 1 [Capsicum baccatum]
MRGAKTTEQGNCSVVRGSPQCCEKEPVIVDHLPEVSYNMQTTNCCKGEVLTSMTQDPRRYGASFEMGIGIASDDGSGPRIPEKFTLGIRRYTCGQPFPVPPSKFSVDKGCRKTKAVATWDVICTYSHYRASSSPTCCVSLSVFYSKTIVPCSICNCGCQGQLAANQCVK